MPTCSQLLALEGPVELQALQLAGAGLGVRGLVEDVVSGLRVLGPGQVQLRHQLQPDVHLTLPVAGAVRRVKVCTADTTFILDNIDKLSISICRYSKKDHTTYHIYNLIHAKVSIENRQYYSV